MIRRTRIELDALLARAKRALENLSTRATVEVALRRAAAQSEVEKEMRVHQRIGYLERLDRVTDPDVLASDEAWRYSRGF